MTKLEIYTILDRVSGINTLMTSPENTEKAMIRAFEDTVKNTPTINRHAEDFVLVRLGKVDQKTGELEENYEEIFEASNFYNNQNKEKGEKN